MFKSLFKKKAFRSETGYFKVLGKELIPLKYVKSGSINDYIESLGYPNNHIYTVLSFDNPKITVLGFKVLTKELVFVSMNHKTSSITFSDVTEALNNVNWRFEYSQLNVEDILNEAIELRNFSLEFVKSIVSLSQVDENLYKCISYGLYLRFENNVLIEFYSSDLQSKSTKWLKGINPNMVEDMIQEAKLYQKTEFDIMTEVNTQTEALLNLPENMYNIYLNKHRTSFGNFNFYNLLIVHYSYDCSKDEFKLMNKGRFKEVKDNILIVGDYIFEFDIEEKLKEVREF